MRVNISELNGECLGAFFETCRFTGLKPSPEGVVLRAEKKLEPGVCVRRSEEGILIRYSELSLFCRALGRLEEEWEETPDFGTRAVMLDMSRNGVMTPEAAEDFARSAALLGFNRIQFYLEDIYEVLEEPYFGALRGRYTPEEISRIEEVSARLGLELMPCIQTLAHFNAPFKWWRYAERIVDCEDILLMDSEESDLFLRHLISSIARIFSSRNIHVGMDEAFRMCCGKYRALHGRQDPAKVFFRHLEKVCALCQEFGLKPAIWSDMAYESAQGERVELPKNLALVYWEYSCTDEEKYFEILNRHRTLFANEVRFAGCALTHAGVVPDNGNAFRTAPPAVAACKRAGVRDVTVTMWGDDGQECSRWAAIPSLVLWGQLLCGGETEESVLTLRAARSFGAEWQDFSAIDKIWRFRKGEPFNTAAKYLLYNDPLLGIFDSLAGDGSYAEHYRRTASELAAIAARGGRYSKLFNTYAALCRALEMKCDLGVRLKNCYDAGNRGGLAALRTELPELLARLQAYRDAHYLQWTEENKIFGFETIDLRIGGLCRRIQTLGERLNGYLSGALAELPELKEARLDFTGQGVPNTSMPTYRYMPTPGVL